MPALDSKVANVLDNNRAVDSDDEDALIAQLEDEEEDAAFSALRERRLNQLHEEMSRAKVMKNASHGTYQQIKDEKQLLDITTSTKLCVVHFMKPDFNRCRIMDEKLAVLAEKHYDTRFVSMNVEHAAFLVVKLKIQVLPCVIAFIDGVSVDRIIGFEGLSNKPDSFNAQDLENRLLAVGVLVRGKMTKEDNARKLQRRTEREEDDDIDEWD
ncbi:hypothetical protein MBLNU230_g2089t1 [Neophaeotheca triangularis]